MYDDRLASPWTVFILTYIIIGILKNIINYFTKISSDKKRRGDYQ